jgi:hypothetical protein
MEGVQSIRAYLQAAVEDAGSVLAEAVGAVPRCPFVPNMGRALEKR